MRTGSRRESARRASSTPSTTSPARSARGRTPAALLEEPGGVLRAQLLEPIRVVETLPVVEITSPREGVRIVDFGQHLSGWTRITASGTAGSTVTLRHAGDVDDNGELDDV